MCLQPKWIYKKGFYKEDNYRGKKGQFYEIGTYSKCGICQICINEKSNNWVVRNYYEEKKHEKKCFITLTYKENPIILVRKDLQNFMKRLRRKITDEMGFKVRMYGAGEYGVLNNRPHYHVIIYGWEDENAKYLDINKKKNIIYKSDIIENTWGLGRTSYQKFNDNEIPYISLYNTANEITKRAYKLTRETLKNLRKYADTKINKMEKNQRKNLLETIKEYEKELEQEKKKYMLAKEFNAWSIALGWEEFEKQYNEQYVFTEYINGKEFITPTPWVKKLANRGSKNATEEMFRREEMIEQSANEEEEIMKSVIKQHDRRKKELEEWLDTQKDIEMI